MLRLMLKTLVAAAALVPAIAAGQANSLEEARELARRFPYENKFVIAGIVRGDIPDGDLIRTETKWRRFAVDGYEAKSPSERAWAVHVHYKAHVGMIGLAKRAIEVRMLELCKTLYTAGIPIWEVSIDAYMEAIDPYGNIEDIPVYGTTMDRLTGARVNWDNLDRIIEHVDLTQLLQVRFIHDELRGY